MVKVTQNRVKWEVLYDLPVLYTRQRNIKYNKIVFSKYTFIVYSTDEGYLKFDSLVINPKTLTQKKYILN